MSFNKVTILGNLGKDPELRNTPQGKKVCSFSVATTEKRKGAADITTWFRVTARERLAEIAVTYLQKGNPVYVEGRLSVSEYEGKQGDKRHSLEVRATDLQLLASRTEVDGYSESPHRREEDRSEFDDDLGF